MSVGNQHIQKLPVTAIVVTCNEESYLEACFESLRWCDQLIVVDLHSKDSSRSIAERYTNDVLSHDSSPIV